MLKTFRIGGVHPPENKISSGEKIKILPIPAKVVIPVGQHIGAPATPVVKKGDTVKVGQLLAKSSGFVSANIHSSVSGTVKSIAAVKDAAGMMKPAITIQVEGDEWMENIDRNAEVIFNKDLSKDDIKASIMKAGIVGMGGATFPTHVKLSPPPGNTAEILIINGVECEPYLTADHRVMLEKSKELLVGIQYLMKGIDVKKAVIGIENNKKDAISLLTELSKNYPGVSVCPLQMKYPQGGEKQLIKAVTGKAVPSGALPIAVGAVVQNIGTALAVYEAINQNKPLFERVVTVTGKSVKNPGNFMCRIGTPISALIDAAGGLPEDTGKVIGGGPMMGRTMINIDSPIMKGTSGILIINEKEALRKQQHNCIRCGKCVSVCPMGLEPYLLMTLSEKNMIDELAVHDVMDCIECGSCTFTCPANRQLLDYIRLGKARTGAMLRAKK